MAHLAHLEKSQQFKLTAINLRAHHLEHCGGENCNVSLSSLLEMAEAAGAQFTRDEKWDFSTTKKMEFVP